MPFFRISDRRKGTAVANGVPNPAMAVEETVTRLSLSVTVAAVRSLYQFSCMVWVSVVVSCKALSLDSRL